MIFLACLLSIPLFNVSFCSEEGKVRKILKAEPLPDGSGHFFNLSNFLISFFCIPVWIFTCSPA